MSEATVMNSHQHGYLNKIITTNAVDILTQKGTLSWTSTLERTLDNWGVLRREEMLLF